MNPYKRLIPKECCGHCAKWEIVPTIGNFALPAGKRMGECTLSHHMNRWDTRPRLGDCFEREVGSDDSI